MAIFVWLLLGLVSGLVASKIRNSEGQGIILDLDLGIAGALLGGFVFQQFGDIRGLNPWSMLVAIGGAAGVLSVKHALAGHRGYARR